MNFLIVGDSHAKCRLPNGGMDSDAIAKRMDVPAQFRLAVSGSTALDWASDKCGWLTEAKRVANRCDAAFISLGGNDLFKAAADGRIETCEVSASVAALLLVIQSIAPLVPKTFVLLYGYPYADQNIHNRLTLLALNASIVSVSGVARSLIGNDVRIEMVDEEKLLNSQDWPGNDIHPFMSGYVKIADEILRKMKAG